MSVVDTGATDASRKRTYDAEFEAADADHAGEPTREREGYPCLFSIETMTSC